MLVRKTVFCPSLSILTSSFLPQTLAISSCIYFPLEFLDMPHTAISLSVLGILKYKW